MKNKIKILTLMSALVMAMFSIVGCSGNNTSTDSSIPSDSNSSVSSLSELSAEEASEPESSVEISYETTSTAESSVYSDSSAIDPAVEERSYTDEEMHEEQDTRFLNYKYRPFNKTYIYEGNESKVIIPSDFTICPTFPQSTSISVKEIIVPESVTKIPMGAFGGCTNLEKLVILNPDCEIEGRIIPQADPDNKYKAFNNKLVNIYCYFRSDKTIPKNHLTGIEGCSKVFNEVGGYYTGKDFKNYIHDLAEEPYK